MESTEPALRTAERPDPPSLSSAEGSKDRFHAAFLWTATALVMAVLWIKPMVSSLWTDEFGTWCAFLASMHSGYITGQNIVLDGGAFPGVI